MRSPNFNSAELGSAVTQQKQASAGCGNGNTLGKQAVSIALIGGCECAAPVPITVCPPFNTPTRTALEAGPIRIRPFVLQDAPELYAAVRESLGQLCGWMTWCRPDYSIEDSRAFILNSRRAWESGEAYSFAIIDLADGKFLGSVGLNHVTRTHNFANVGYWVRSTRTRCGVASTALRLAAWFGLRELAFERLELLVPTGNIASQRVAQKAGAKFEGLLRNRLVLAGLRHDAAIYSIVADDLALSKQP
jgi:ribosomal-protein-serine acetyltransferase